MVLNNILIQEYKFGLNNIHPFPLEGLSYLHSLLFNSTQVVGQQLIEPNPSTFQSLFAVDLCSG